MGVVDFRKRRRRTFSIPMDGEHYTLSSPDLQSKTVQLNGSELQLGADDAIPHLSGIPTRSGTVTFAPASITFLATLEANNRSCR